jgi:hypothetical protein
MLITQGGFMLPKKNEKIEARFAKSQSALVLQQSDLSLGSISDMVLNGAIDISPKYQRRERWDPVKESGLIESFLLNIPVPPIYLAEDEYGTYSVIDGKQRVTAINKFLNGKLRLTNLEKFKELEDCSFSELPTSLSNALKIRPYLRVVTLLRQSDPELKHEVFLRLNKAGVALNSQEIRNVAYRGKLNDLLFELSKNAYLNAQLKATVTSKTYKEMIDVQYVLRFFTMREYWQQFPGNMDVAMDTFMRANYKMSIKDVSLNKTIFEDAITFCKAIWGDEGFMRPGGNTRVLQGFFDIHMVCSSLLTLQEQKNAIAKKEKVKRALSDMLTGNIDFSESLTQFTSNAENVKIRIAGFCKMLREV